MPAYDFKNKETGELQEVILRISELDEFKLAHPELEQVHTSAPTLARDSGNLKPDNGFRDVLKSIKKASGRSSTVNTF